MTGRDRADGKDVFRPHPNVREVSRRVARLPLDYFVSRVFDHWTVVGPTGVFVVGRSGDDLVAACDETSSLAQQIRADLSDLIPWVPFVDALVVAGEERSDLSCTVLEIDMLESTLLGGPPSIDDRGISQLRRHLPGVLRGIATHAPLDPA